MKYYEVSEPYYALLKANTEEEAILEYARTVAEDDGTLQQSIKEVNPYYAIITYGRGLSEDGEEISVNELVEDLSSKEAMTLLVDGSFL